MYSDKQNVNILTAQLINADIHDIVVCPGSRNAPLVHNFFEATEALNCFRLHPVTDERSAAFYAIGVWLATRKPVAVCVTSGSALLNTIPGVAEAYYRHIPLVIISADRPPQWIGQLDGQTIPQNDALYPYAQTVQIDEKPSVVAVPAYNPNTPLHINVPISEPLFNFSTVKLPEPEYSFFEQWPESDNGIEDLDKIADLINNAILPAVIVGQYEDAKPIASLVKLDKENKLLLLPELISNQPGSMRTTWIEAVKAEGIPMPDVVIHIGGALVNKWLKLKLRKENNLKVIRVDKTDDYPDTFSHLEIKVKYDETKFFDKIAPYLISHDSIKDFKQRASEFIPQSHSTKSKVIGALCKTILTGSETNDTTLFFGNSSAVRIATRHLASGIIPTYCNRGVNGIEGSLSVAAGYSAVSTRNTYVIIGDLSFFYDVNALWNTQLHSNLRILLLNDHCGGIFSHLPGLAQSPALMQYVSAHHSCNAKGIAMSYNCSYIYAQNQEQLSEGLCAFTDFHTGKDLNNDKPIILEYDTNLERN